MSGPGALNTQEGAGAPHATLQLVKSSAVGDDTRNRPGVSGSPAKACAARNGATGDWKSRQSPGLPGATAPRGAQPPPPQGL